jgi:23S rRNA pseudouridine1911/1915/1917 synthase
VTVTAVRVADVEDGECLDRLLAAPLGSRSRAGRLIDEGRVLVDGQPSTRRYTVRPGQLIEIDDPEGDGEGQLPASATPPGPLPSTVVIAYEDDALLIVDKPAGLVVHPGRGHHDGTLAQLLHGRVAGGSDPSRAGIVHRLDRDTSGLLVVARTELAHRRLRESLTARTLEREYHALVEGRPPARTGTIEAPIGRDRAVRTRVSLDTDVPKEARTHFTLEQALAQTTLLRVKLDTGRTHQIRVHLLAIGYPVAGDPVYGTPGLLGLERQFLHATRIAFPHPITDEPIEIVSPLPPDLEAALERAGGQAG